MKTRGHIYMANLLLQELREQEGCLTLPTVPDDKGKVEYLKYQIPDQIYTAIRNHPGCFRAGAVGPDFFPDMQPKEVKDKIIEILFAWYDAQQNAVMNEPTELDNVIMSGGESY